MFSTKMTDGRQNINVGLVAISTVLGIVLRFFHFADQKNYTAPHKSRHLHPAKLL